MSISRENFHYALRAVLEHVGSANRHLDFVGFSGGAMLWATDGYTAGMCQTPTSLDATESHFPHGDLYLPVKEARDMMRFVRPERVRDREMRVELKVAENLSFNPGTGDWTPGDDNPVTQELHVGILPDDPNSDDITSEVYSLYPSDYPKVNFDSVWRLLEEIRKDTFYTDEFVLQPSFAARFKAAERQLGDRMRWHPASPVHGRAGQRAIVTVGSDFLGAMIGLGEPLDTEIPFGDSTLLDWGL